MSTQRVMSIIVLGTPQAKGSMKSIPFADKESGKLRVNTFSDSKRSDAWENTVKLQALSVWRRNLGADALPLEGAVKLRIGFRLPRPKSVSVKKRPLPIVKPDVDKMLRSILDALTGVVFNDDAQVTAIEARKTYAAVPSAACVVIDIYQDAAGVAAEKHYEEDTG